MKIKSILSLIIFCHSLGFVHAIVIQKITLKDGSVLEGYISMQRPGKEFVFIADRATINMPDLKVKSVVNHEQKETLLPTGWVDWASQTNSFTGFGKERSLVLSDIITNDGIISQVRILQKGETVKYYEIAQKKYSFSWDTVAFIQTEKRSPAVLSGLNRSYQLSNGSKSEGQYVEEIPGKTTTISQSDGIEEVLQFAQILSFSVKKNNPNQPLFEQAKLLDEIVLKNGGIISGLIIEQNYGKSGSSNSFLIIQNENEDNQSVKFEDIAEFRKMINPKYKEIQDVILNKGDVYVNRVKASDCKAASSTANGITFAVDASTISISRSNYRTEINLESKQRNNSQQLVLVKASRVKDKKTVSYEITYENIVKNPILPILTQTSINGTVKAAYILVQAGMYVIYDPDRKTIIPFELK